LFTGFGEVLALKYIIVQGLLGSVQLFTLRLSLKTAAASVCTSLVIQAAVLVPYVNVNNGNGLSSRNMARFNVYAMWGLTVLFLAAGFMAQKNNERQARCVFWNNKQLLDDLAAAQVVKEEKQKRAEAEARTNAVHDLIAYLCHEVRCVCERSQFYTCC
jgi:heme A synthase